MCFIIIDNSCITVGINLLAGLKAMAYLGFRYSRYLLRYLHIFLLHIQLVLVTGKVNMQKKR